MPLIALREGDFGVSMRLGCREEDWPRFATAKEVASFLFRPRGDASSAGEETKTSPLRIPGDGSSLCMFRVVSRSPVGFNMFWTPSIRVFGGDLAFTEENDGRICPP